MKRIRHIYLGLTTLGIIGASTIGVVSAATPASSGNIGKSGIPRSVFKEERLDAASQVLNVPTTSIQTAHKDKTMSQLISNAGLTKETYRTKLKTQLTTDLEAKGYSQDQVTIALQHRHINHMRANRK